MTTKGHQVGNHFLACVPGKLIMVLEASDDIVYQSLERSLVIFSVVVGFQTPDEIIAHDSELVCFVPDAAPVCFEKPEQFIPERWLTQDKEAQQRHEKFFVPFSKGPRNCLGINLAGCEMYLALASLYRRFDIKLDGTKDEDFNWIDVGLALFKSPLKCYVSPVVE